MRDEKFHGNRSARFWEIRKTDTQTDRQTRHLYIYTQHVLFRVAFKWPWVTSNHLDTLSISGIGRVMRFQFGTEIQRLTMESEYYPNDDKIRPRSRSRDTAPKFCLPPAFFLGSFRDMPDPLPKPLDITAVEWNFTGQMPFPINSVELTALKFGKHRY